jgi:hypothetical protein
MTPVLTLRDASKQSASADWVKITKTGRAILTKERNLRQAPSSPG